LASETDRLNVRRSAILLQCQRSRKDRRRIDVLRAEQARNSAVAAETLADEQRDALSALQAARLNEAHDAVRERVVDLHALKVLTTLEQGLQKEAVAMTAALAEAQEHLREAQLVLTEASAVLRLEIKATHRRERLANKLLEAWSRATEAVSETEREEQAIDNWNSG
jgi:hypothetical protein